VVPFDISSIGHTPSPSSSSAEEQPTQNPVSPSTIEYIAAIAGIAIITALVIYFKKHRQ
jgi:hypothetical protein